MSKITLCRALICSFIVGEIHVKNAVPGLLLHTGPSLGLGKCAMAIDIRFGLL